MSAIRQTAMEDGITPQKRDILVIYWHAGDHIGIITHPGLRRQHHNHWWGIKVNDHQRTVVDRNDLKCSADFFNWSDGDVHDKMK